HVFYAVVRPLAVTIDTLTCSFFFFQAEDGIRDLIVTGVQTCALPISREIEGAPRAVAGAERAQQRQMEHVDAGLIDVVEVAVRHVALADPQRDVVHDRRVLDERRGQREDEQDHDEQAEAGDHHRAAARAGAHQIVLGIRYRCWSRPSTPRGMSRTTATMMMPKSSGWTYG